MIIDPYKFGGVSGSTVEASLTQSPVDASGSGASRTVSGVGFGAAVAGRKVVVVVRWLRGSGTCTLSSATIGGVSATIHRQVTAYPAFFYGYRHGLAVISALVPSGTSGTVALTFSATPANQPNVAAYRVVNLLSHTAGATASASGTSDTASTSINVVSGGVVFSELWHHSNGPTTPTVVTKQYESIVGIAYAYAAGGFASVAATETGKALSWSGPFAYANTRWLHVAVAFR